MPGKIFFLLLVISYWLLVVSSPVKATPTPAPTILPTCDLCGWCPPNPTITPPPPNWQECNQCLYKSDGTPRERAYYTIFGCLSTDSGLFAKSILSIVLGIAGGIAFLAVLGGSAIVLTSSGNPERLQSGKDMVTSSLLGLLLIVFSIFLLRVVGFDILRIPGFGG